MRKYSLNVFQELLKILEFQNLEHTLVGYAYCLLHIIILCDSCISSTWFWVRPLCFSAPSYITVRPDSQFLCTHVYFFIIFCGL